MAELERPAVPPTRIDAHFEKIAAEVGSTVKNVKNVFKKGRRLDELRFQLSTSRMLDRIIEQAKLDDTVKPALG